MKCKARSESVIASKEVVAAFATARARYGEVRPSEEEMPHSSASSYQVI